MVRGILGIDAKRAFILLAVTVAVMFSASGLMPGEPDAQTAFTNGKIAYVGFNVETEKQDIYTINPDGTGVTNLTRRYTDPTWSPLGSARSDPEWSPDGAKISYQSRRAGQDDIWVVDAPPPLIAAASFSALSVGTDTAVAAAAPRNLTANSSIEAGSPDWGTAPSGGGSVCTISGTARANTLNGTSDADVICGLVGNDTVYGAGGNDVIRGGPGSDTLKGQGDDDQVIGNSGSDKLFGGGGDDTVNSKDTISANDAFDGGTHVAGDKKVTDSTEKSIVDIP